MKRLLKPFSLQIRYYARSNNVLIDNSLKPASVKIRHSKPINSTDHRKKDAYDVELGLKQSVLSDFIESRVSETNDDFDEDDYLLVVNNPEMFYSEHETEERKHRKMVRRKTIERTYFKTPKEPCLLSWAARDQIYYLHNLDPDEWTPKRLSESFPISETVVKKLLKSYRSSSYVTEERKKRNDALVAENWKMLMTGNLKNVKPELLQLQKEGKLNTTLALPNKQYPQGKLPLETPKKIESPKEIGEFLAIVKPYLHKTKPDLLPIEESKALAFQEPDVVSRSSIRPDEIPFHSANNLNSQAKFKTNHESKHPDSSTTMFYNDKRDKTTDINEDTVMKNEPKYNKPLELTIDSDNAYLYSSATGYQHPMGKSAMWRDKINIPRSKFKQGAIYKVDDSFYSDDGEFLYRIP